MGQTTFGFGDQTSINNWTFSAHGQGFDNEWEGNSHATGQFGRIVSLAARWDGYTGGAGACSNPTGNSALWSGNHAPDLTSGTYTAGTTATGSVPAIHNASTSDFWQNNGTYWNGFQSNGCLYHSGVTNNGFYTGSSGSTGPGGGSNNWGGTGGWGFGSYGTVQVTEIFIRRSGIWTSTRVYIRRSGAWVSAPINIRRSGAWTVVNWLREYHIPEKGIEVEVNVGEGWEKGWIVETDEYGWFGSIDPTTLGVEWWKPGHWLNLDKFTGRYNSAEPNEIAEKRLTARHEWDQALRGENYREAAKQFKLWQPGSHIETPVLDDPEPILLGCGCV